MRLSPQYIDVFSRVISEYLDKNDKAELRLYGSRVHDELKGGDIDLLLLIDEEKNAKSIRLLKPKILGKIFQLIDEQKIDLLIMSYEKAKQDAFVQMILKGSVVIQHWGRNSN